MTSVRLVLAIGRANLYSLLLISCVYSFFPSSFYTFSILLLLYMCGVFSTSSQTDIPTYSNIYFSSLCFSSLFVIWISRSDI